MGKTLAVNTDKKLFDQAKWYATDALKTSS